MTKDTKKTTTTVTTPKTATKKTQATTPTPKKATDKVLSIRVGGKYLTKEKVSTSTLAKLADIPVSQQPVVVEEKASKPTKKAVKEVKKPQVKVTPKQVATPAKKPSKKVVPVFDTKVAARKDKPQVKTKDVVLKMHSEITRVFS